MTIIELDPFNGVDCVVRTEDSIYRGVLSYTDPLEGINIDEGTTTWTVDADTIIAIGLEASPVPSGSISFTNLMLIVLGIFLIYQSSRKE